MSPSREQIIENREKWVAALRSGKYAQGFGNLRVRPAGNLPAAYCCLGVAADACRLGSAMNLVLGLESRRAVGLNRDSMQQLINMNDRDKASFSQIADVIDTLPIAEETAEETL